MPGNNWSPEHLPHKDWRRHPTKDEMYEWRIDSVKLGRECTLVVYRDRLVGGWRACIRTAKWTVTWNDPIHEFSDAIDIVGNLANDINAI